MADGHEYWAEFEKKKVQGHCLSPFQRPVSETGSAERDETRQRQPATELTWVCTRANCPLQTGSPPFSSLALGPTARLVPCSLPQLAAAAVGARCRRTPQKELIGETDSLADLCSLLTNLLNPVFSLVLLQVLRAFHTTRRASPLLSYMVVQQSVPRLFLFTRSAPH